MVSPNTLKKDRAVILNALDFRKDGTAVARIPLVVQVPVRYEEIGFLEIDDPVMIYGMLAFIVNDRYAVLNLNSMVKFARTSITITKIDDKDYYNFIYNKGDTVIVSDYVAQNSFLIFVSLDEFILKGKIPWYVGYDDIGSLFDTSKDYAGSKATIIPQFMEIVATYLGRQRKNRKLFLKDGAKTYDDFETSKISWVPVRSVYWSSPGTLNKLSGAYFEDGVVGSLVTPSKNSEYVESLVRA